MLPLERRRKIIEYITLNQSVRVIDLSKDFNVTEETIRRDLEKLEKENILVRTYGGAVLVEKEQDDMPFSIRSMSNLDSKKVIGSLINELIKDGDIVMMDSSTTSLEVAKVIGNSKNITLITNSMGLSTEMSQCDNVQVICSGGILRRKSLSFIGPTANKSIQNYYADKAIFSCKGIDMNKGIMESNEIEAEVKISMIHTSQTVILAIDNTKFNALSMIRLSDFSKVDIVVTNIRPSDEWLKFFDNLDIQCIFPQ